MEKAIRWRPLIPHPLRAPARQAGAEYDLPQSAFVTLALRYVLWLLGKLPEKFELEGFDLIITQRWSLPVLVRTLEEDRETAQAAVRKMQAIAEIRNVAREAVRSVAREDIGLEELKDRNDDVISQAIEAGYERGWAHHREDSLAALEALAYPGATGGGS